MTELLQKWFDLEEVAVSGTSVAIVGIAGSGKTTLVKGTMKLIREIGEGKGDSVYGHKSPFTFLVHAHKRSMVDYFNLKWIRKSHVEPTKRRFVYLVERRYREAVVVMEDIAEWFKSIRREELLSNIFALRRKEGRKYLLIVVVESLYDLEKYVDRFSHIVLVGSAFKGAMIKQFFDPDDVKTLTTLRRRMSRHDYIIIDARERFITKPYDSENPLPLVLSLAGRIEDVAHFVADEEQIEAEIIEEPVIKAQIVIPEQYIIPDEALVITKSIPIYIQVGEVYRKEPEVPAASLATKFGTSEAYIYWCVNKCKELGMLEGGKRYGAPRRISY